MDSLQTVTVILTEAERHLDLDGRRWDVTPAEPGETRSINSVHK